MWFSVLVVASCWWTHAHSQGSTFPVFPRQIQIPSEAFLHNPTPHRPMRSYGIAGTAGVHIPYVTFDGASIHTTGRCKYLLAEPCKAHFPPEWQWRVSVVNKNSTPHFVIIEAMAHTIKLAPGQMARVDNRLCSGNDYPCNANFNRIRVGKLTEEFGIDGLYCYVEEFHLLVTLQREADVDGVSVPHYNIDVMVLSDSLQLDDVMFYREGMCGMFGNFNNDVTDDVNADDPEQTLYANWQNKDTCGF